MYAKNCWEKYDGEKVKEVMAFGEEYKKFISECKTERECTSKARKLALAHGFRDGKNLKELKAGDRVFFTNKEKNIAVFIIGEKPLTEGLRILGAHIDSPRLDLKQNPLYEKNNFALLDTHYYGGIKKYQWVTIPLGLRGIVCKKDGTMIEIQIGDKEDDPVFGIGDLLIHLSQEQLQKKASSLIEGEDLDLTVGNIPLPGTEKDAVKANILKLLKEKYDFEEEDFLSAELEVVPVGQARDYGLDRSMIAGYGHDDRVCAYTSLRALLDTDVTTYTAAAVLVDKEEIGSVGATGAHSKWFENIVSELIALQGDYNDLKLRRALENSRMLSSDVSAGFDPLFANVNDPKNAAYLGNGITFNKYTGSRGKSGANDAMPEYFASIRNIFDNNDINYQTAELGKVDQGGGGTIAYILGNYNMNVIDAGIPVLNMHAPQEIVSKADVYEAYRAYRVFIEN